MTSEKKVKPDNSFDGLVFDDTRISELNQQYCNGEISAEEYMDKLLSKYK